jgi:hypothetical protein
MKRLGMFSIILIMLPLLQGCPVEGDDGRAGVDGLPGINCWDLNGDRVDDQDEDVNFDGAWNALDCRDTGSIAQVKEAELNHQHFCDAFANLLPPVYPDGCPSASATAPSGTLTQFYTSTDSKFFDDGANGYTSCNNTPNNGPLSIVYRTGTIGSAFFELEEAYIAKRETVQTASEIDNDDCYNLCNGDARCIASLAYKVDSDLQSSECLIFYHSDTVSKFERICGADLSIDARDVCKQGLGLNNRWSAKCP